MWSWLDSLTSRCWNCTDSFLQWPTFGDICNTIRVPRLLNHPLSHYCAVSVRNAARSTMYKWWESVSGVSHGGNDGQQCRCFSNSRKQRTLSGISLTPRRKPSLLPLLFPLHGLSCCEVLMCELSDSISSSVILPTSFLRNKRGLPKCLGVYPSEALWWQVIT